MEKREYGKYCVLDRKVISGYVSEKQLFCLILYESLDLKGEMSREPVMLCDWVYVRAYVWVMDIQKDNTREILVYAVASC